jgi:hypothetical protein
MSAKFIDHFLQPIAKEQDSFIRDTDHFQAVINSVRFSPDESVFLVTMDVESLYTNIPTEAGIRAVRRAFQKSPHPSRPDEELLQLLDINLNRNDFVFNGTRYLQIKGTSMGKAFAPSYANIYMSDWETRALEHAPFTPSLYKRYIDDIFLIFVGTEPQLLQLYNHLNCFDNNIRLSIQYSQAKINFLDCMVSVKNDENGKRLVCSVYFKPTDSRQLLNPDSFHPRHTFKGVIKSQFLRYARRCTLKEDFDLASSSLMGILKKQGHTVRSIRDVKKSALTQLGYYIDCRWEFGFQHCNLDCRLCTHYGQFGQVCPGSNSTKMVYKISQKLNCESSNAVYAILCRKCSSRCVYVGETGGALKCRIRTHLSDIKHSKDTAVSRHFRSEGHSLQEFHFMGLWCLSTESTASREGAKRRRRDMEEKLIALLCTQTPAGLNTVDSNKGPCVPIVIPYTDHSTRMVRQIRNVISEHTEELHTVAAYTRSRNLKDILCPSNLRSA